MTAISINGLIDYLNQGKFDFKSEQKFQIYDRPPIISSIRPARKDSRDIEVSLYHNLHSYKGEDRYLKNTFELMREKGKIYLRGSFGRYFSDVEEELKRLDSNLENYQIPDKISKMIGRNLDK